MAVDNKRHLIATGIAAVCLLIASSGINAESTCRTGCPQSDVGQLQYKPGNVYEYNFDSIMTVGLNAGAETDDTSLKMLGTAKLFAEGNCGYTLQLSAIKVSATKESIEKKLMQSIQKPVHFTMAGGKLEPELCTDASDTAYALNIKRAVISLLQSNTNSESGAEVDVFGQCPTHTSVSKVGTSEVVTKVRNLNNCAYREKINSGIINGVTNDKSDIKSTMLLRADYAKEVKIEHGVVENVQLVEEYKFMGAPKGGADVRAKVITSLKLKGNAAGAPAAAPASGTNGVSIIFQTPEVYAAKNIAALKAAMSEIVELTGDYVRKDSAKSFVDLIRLMRQADAATLLELAAVPQPNKVLARKVYLDALFRTGTAESAKAIIKQLNKLEEKEKLIAVLSLNLVQTVDKDVLNQAATLLTANAPKEVYLAVGSLVAKYCQRNGCSGDIDAISKKFTDNLKHCKANTKKDEERIVYILKGIGNTQHLASSVAGTLAECAAPGHSNRIRVAALQAFSAASCESALQKKAIALLRDRNEDSELRIEAYLAAITCPTAEMANDIADIVNSETVYQVGGFITSSLRTIRDSTDKTREYQRHYLGNIRVTKQFPSDYRRYSYNNEISYKLDALGVSASADHKLIYSQHGFLPRSARLNISTEVFGTNFNVFEANVRQENLENVLEYYLGPKGLLNKDFDEIMKVIEVGGGEGGRARRSIADDTSNFAKKYKTYGSKNVQDLNLDLSLKLFGSEIMFLSLGDSIPSSLDDIIKHFSTAFEGAKKELSSFDKKFTQHSLFLDSKLVYPTGLGIPIELSSTGFSANKLDIGINVDVDAILEQNWQNAKYRFKLIPSVDVSVNVQLGFNAHVLSTGLRLESNMHSAAGSDVNLAFINDGNGFNMDIELPREKLELIDMQIGTEFYIAEQDKPSKSIAIKGSKKQHSASPPQEICFNQFEVVGFTYCFTSSITDLNKPSGSGAKSQSLVEGLHLSRPFTLAMYITSERKFNLKGYHIPQTSTGAQQWKLDFSTPGSKVPHDTSLAFELGTKPNTYGRISLTNPNYHFALEAGANNDDKEIVLYAQYEHDKDVKRNKIGFVKNGNEYRPVIEIQDKNGVTNDINGYRADGKVIVQKTGDKTARYTFENIQVTNKDNERVVVNGFADVGPASLETELRVSPGQQTYKIKSSFKLENGLYVVGAFVNDEKTPDNVIGAQAEVKLGQQDYNVLVIGKAGTWEVDSANELQYSKSEESNAVTYSKFRHELQVKNKNNPVGSLKVNGVVDGPNKFQFEAEVLRGKKVTSLAVKFNGNQRSQNDYLLEVNGKMNKHTVDLLAKCDVSGARYVIDNQLTTSWGTAVTVKGELGQRYAATDIFVDIVGTAQFSGKDKPTQWLLKVIGSPEKTTSEFKLSRDNAELVKYNGELTHPQDKITAAKINVVVKNTITGKADFKMAKNGKGEVVAVIETQKTEPKHKIEVNAKFHILAPKYDIDTTITIDSDKKLSVTSENVVDKLKFSTKNVVEVANKKVSFDANGSVKGEWKWNGEVQGNFVLTCPDDHVIDGTIKRKVTTNAKTGVAQGNLDLQLNDQVGGKKRTLGVNGKLEKANLKAKEFATNINVAYTNFEGKKIDAKYTVKHLPNGDNKMIDFAAAVHGDLLNQAIDIAFVVDEYSSKHAIYRLSAKNSDKVSVSANGNYHVGDRGKPCTYEIQGSVQVPQASFKSIDLSSHGKFLKPEMEDGGAYIVEVHIDEKTGNDQFVKFNTLWKGSRQQGAYNVALETKQMQGPLKLEGSYQREQSGNIKEGNMSGKQKYSFNANYADKYVKSTADMSFVGTDTASLQYTIDTSFESVKDVAIEVRGQKLDGDSYAVQVNAKQSGNAYSVDSKIYRSSHKKGIDVHIALPNGEPITVVGIFEQLGERKAKFTLQVEHLADLDVSAEAEAHYKTVDDFYVVAKWNSAKLNLNNYDLDVRSQGKAITFNLKNANEVVFAGSATYALKKEKNKSIIEGQGQLTYKGKTQNSNFRLIHQIYDITADKEIGISYTFNGNFGPKNGVSTLKVTNKDFNVKLSVCEEKKQCTNVQVQSIVTADEQNLDSIQHSILVLIDLRELGYPYEFEFQSKTIRNGFKFQYSLDSNIISNNNMKYQLIANVLPTSSKVQLRLPSREILFESKQQFPQQGHIFGHYENSAEFWFDKKNKPNDVSRLVSSADVSGVERASINVNGQIKFEHPTIRPITVTGKVDANRQQQIANAEVVFDIFRLPEQQITAFSRIQNTESGHGYNVTTNHGIRSSGLGFQYEFNAHAALKTDIQEFSTGADASTGTGDMKVSAFIFGNRNKVEILVHALNQQVVQLIGEYDRQSYASKFSTKLQVFGQQPVEFSSQLQPTMAKFAVKREGLLDATGEIQLNKEAKFNVQGAGKQIFTGRVALDAANFLTTTYKTNEDDVNAFLNTVESEIKKDTEVTREKIKARFQKLRVIVEKQLQLYKEGIPDFTQLTKSYNENVNEIVKELESDPSLKQIAETYRHLYAKLAKIAGDIAKTTAESYQDVHKSFAALYEKWEVVLKDTILPAWEEFMISATKIVGELRVEIVNLATKTFHIVLSALEKYGPALKHYGKAVNDALKPLQEAIQEIVKIAAQAIEELSEELRDYIAKLPTLDAIRSDIKERLQKMKLLEKTLEFINGFFDQLQIIPKTAETTEFLQRIHEYIEAKLKQTPVDDEKILGELAKLLLNALYSIWPTAELSSSAGFAPNLINALTSSVPFSRDLFGKIPALLSFRFSVLNFLLNESWENILTRNHFKSWIFFNDFQLKGHVADGHHILTFDGQHISFPGSCKYILAQDSVDNNFTVVATLNAGKLKSIILSDREGNFVEVADTGVLKMNGQSVEYPQHQAGGLHAWRLFYTVWLRSEYGVQVMCTSDLKVCHVEVNGFYTSKTRGLLGNGNAEPNDDFIQPDGKISSDYAAFGNGYALGGKCAPVAAKPPVDQHTDLCNEIFGLDSPLAIGYLFMDSAPYRAACDDAVSSAAEKDQEAAACTIALAYGSALKMSHVPVVLPSRCLKCAGAAGQRDIDQEFTVKVPTNKADVVFVVDVGVQPVVLSNLVAPAITEMRDTLKARGFTDVQISVVAYNASQRYPALLTSDNGKLNYQGNIAKLDLNGPKHFCDSCITQVVNDKKILEVYDMIEKLIKSIVPQSDEMAFNLALNYPFRAGAAKSIIGVRSDSLDFANVFKFVRAHIAGAVSKFDAALLHMIGPVKGMSLEGVASEKLIGFNARLVATLDGKDAKKRQKLQFENDIGIDFVLNNGGWVFATQNFENLKPQDQKKALSQVTNSIADTLFKTEIVSDCKCVPVHGLHAQHKCTIKSSTFVPNKKPKAA